MKRAFFTILFLTFSSLSFAMSSLPSSEVSDNLISKTAPEFTLEKISGVSQSLVQARVGKKAILFFWATWCPHCHEELETIRQKLDGIKKQNIEIVLVNVGETKEEAKAFLNHQEISLDSFIDEDNTVAGLYGVVGIPSLFFIDEKGVIRAIEHGLSVNYETKFN